MFEVFGPLVETKKLHPPGHIGLVLGGIQARVVQGLVPMDVGNQLMPQDEQKRKSQTQCFDEPH